MRGGRHPRGAALLVGHGGAPQGHGAHAPQLGGQRPPVRTGRATLLGQDERSPCVAASLLPHLWVHGEPQLPPVGGFAVRDDARVRPGALLGAGPRVWVHQGPPSAAHRAGARQAPRRGPLRHLEPQDHYLRGGAARQGGGGGVQRPARRVRCEAGLGHVRAEPHWNLVPGRRPPGGLLGAARRRDGVQGAVHRDGRGAAPGRGGRGSVPRPQRDAGLPQQPPGQRRELYRRGGRLVQDRGHWLL
mmetsp:Transcript_56510/g.128141  ORF Transcript_56510/g.128141 Transcript_56510/m.128141 type:complete len:245 (-) Transcript_56510:412-1146(-)